MAKPLKLAIIYGGQSTEHAVSIESALNLVQSLDTQKYTPLLIRINESGSWHLQTNSQPALQQAALPGFIPTLWPEHAPAIALLPDYPGQLINLHTTRIESEIDVVFPLVHGRTGEDGSLQGFLNMANVPYVGCDVMSSSIIMDKDISKRLLKEAGLPVVDHLAFNTLRYSPTYDEIVDALGDYFFVKPANSGSSIGISAVTRKSEFRHAMHLAQHFDHKVVFEQGIRGRELECGVVGNHTCWTSAVGEVLCSKPFYDYEAKYWDTESTHLRVPADIDKRMTEQVQYLSERAFQALDCQGMARVDFFLKGDQLWINELNTLPGLTSTSLFPKLWEHSGIAFSELCDKLIELAIQGHQQKQTLKTTLDCF
ncbi:D-alanine--D-alanine ligase [Aurantivibrio plasticivorans]